MRLFYTIWFLGLLAMPLFSQEVVLQGVIYGDKQEPLPNANILVRSRENNRVLSYGIADEAGNFRISIEAGKIADATISFSFLGFRTVTRDLSGTEEEFRITLVPESFHINEVLVKAPKIRAQGDTLVYNVGSYAREYDKTIGDVLKRLPGIEVKESGQIHFNGVPINKFYIEGADLLEGKYGIATNSISSRDISVVEVLQDHQPIKALEGLSYSDRAAINLKLKENAKAKWIGTFRGGVGLSPLLWNAQLTGMRFTKKLQTLNTYKTNNTGSDIARETTSFDIRDFSRRSDRLPDYITVTPPQSLGLKRNRELFNRTHQLTTHNLSKLKNDFDVRVSSTFTAHRETQEKHTETVYFETEGETTTILENESSLYHRKNLGVGVTLEGNKSRYNLTNRLNGNFSWTDRKIGLTGSYPNRQKAFSPTQQLANDLYLFKRFGKDFITVESTLAYQHHPQELEVIRNASRQAQDISQSGFSTDNKIGYGLSLGNITTTFTAGIAVMEKSLETTLTGVEIENLNSSGNTRFGYVRPYLLPQFEYNFWKITTTLRVPVNYYSYHYKNRDTGERLNYNTVLVNPRLNLNLKFTNHIRLSLSGNIGKAGINDRLFYPATILSDYRSLSEGMPEYIHITRKSVSGSLKYNRPLDELFCDLSVNRNWNETPYTLSQSFIDEYILSRYVPATNKSDGWQINGSINKGVGFLKGHLYLNATFQKSNTLLIRNESQVASTRNNFTLTPRLETQPSRFLVINYQLSYAQNILKVESSSKVKRNNITQELAVRILPTPKFNILLRGEHYYNEISENEKKNFFFSDLSLTYKLTKKVELAIDANNLLNQKRYAYVSFMNDASAIYRNYAIRPRNILVSSYVIF